MPHGRPHSKQPHPRAPHPIITPRLCAHSCHPQCNHTPTLPCHPQRSPTPTLPCHPERSRTRRSEGSLLRYRTAARALHSLSRYAGRGQGEASSPHENNCSPPAQMADRKIQMVNQKSLGTITLNTPLLNRYFSGVSIETTSPSIPTRTLRCRNPSSHACTHIAS